MNQACADVDVTPKRIIRIKLGTFGLMFICKHCRPAIYAMVHEIRSNKHQIRVNLPLTYQCLWLPSLKIFNIQLWNNPNHWSINDNLQRNTSLVVPMYITGDNQHTIYTKSIKEGPHTIAIANSNFIK